MALRQAKVQPTVQEKRYITLQFLESAYMSGNRVIITPVDTYDLTVLSGEVFTYKDPVETYIIYDERPKVGLLKKFGWFREDVEELPQIAYIPTHLLYNKVTDEIVNEVLLFGDEMQDLIKFGESDTYELKPLEIKRGTLIDVFFDFAPDARTTAANYDGEINPFNRPIESSTVINRFYITDPKMDTVSINYICKLMPYKYDAAKEFDEEGTENPANGEFLDFPSDSYHV